MENRKGDTRSQIFPNSSPLWWCPALNDWQPSVLVFICSFLVPPSRGRVLLWEAVVVLKAREEDDVNPEQRPAVLMVHQGDLFLTLWHWNIAQGSKMLGVDFYTVPDGKFKIEIKSEFKTQNYTFYNTGNKLKNALISYTSYQPVLWQVKRSLNDHKHICGLLKGAKLAPLSQGSLQL